MKISFIVPYIDDREQQFLVNLTSLELQTDQDYEVICVYQDSTITNPSAAFNWGVMHAKGDILCLTSPEVLNMHTNVAFMKRIPHGTYWVGKVLEPNAGRINANTTEENWQTWKYFLGVLWKKDYIKIGGMDDDYMDGIAWEDRDFALRAGKLDCFFNGSIVGIHLPHSRKYQDDGPELRLKNRRIYERKVQSQNQR